MYSAYLKTITIWFSLVLILFILTGCATDINKTLQGINETLQDIGISEKVQTNKILANNEIAGDIQLSISALIMEMRHKHLNSNIVSFDKKGSHTIYEENFKYENFRWDFFKISKYELISQDSHSSNFKLEGLISFSDEIGRSTSSLVSIDYKVINNKRIIILNSEIFQHYLKAGNVQTYFIPYDTFKKKSKSLESFVSIYKFATKNAVRVRANENESAAYERLSLIDKMKGILPDKSIQDKYVAVVFGMERFPAKSLFTIDIGDNQGRIYTESTLPIIYQDYDGWNIGIVGFEGKVRALNSIFTINIYFQEKENSNKQLIAMFNNAMDYTKVKVSNGPLAKGEILLNPNIKTNAKIIQSRLYFLEYYSGKIDGYFGKNSQKALAGFILDKMKVHYNKWSLEVQKELFNDTGF